MTVRIVPADFIRDGWTVHFRPADLVALARDLHPAAATANPPKTLAMQVAAAGALGIRPPSPPLLPFAEIAERLVRLDPVAIDIGMKHGLKRKDGRPAGFAFDDLDVPLKTVADALLDGLTAATLGELPPDPEPVQPEPVKPEAPSDG